MLRFMQIKGRNKTRQEVLKYALVCTLRSPPAYIRNCDKSTGPPSPRLARLLVALGEAAEAVVVVFSKLKPPISHQFVPLVVIGYKTTR